LRGKKACLSCTKSSAATASDGAQECPQGGKGQLSP
jgi:hypothetical protein